MHTVTRYHDFSAGHRVHGHESKCAHLHGHNYRVHFTCVPDPNPDLVAVHIGNGVFEVRGTPRKPGLDSVGRVIDFGVIKERLCEWLEEYWDHKFLIWERDPLWPYLADIDRAGVVRVPFNPTAENMAEFLVKEVGPRVLMGTGVVLLKVQIEETAKCSASYTSEDVL